MDAIRPALDGLLEALGHGEEPMGVYYTDTPPADGFHPKPGPRVSFEKEQRGEMDWGAMWGNFSCVLGQTWLARKKGKPAWFEAEAYGCPGGSFFLGFHKPQADFICRYVSSGVPGAAEGEKYMRTPEEVRAFFTGIDPRPAPGRCCVIQPLRLFEGVRETPEVVVFFARGEVLSGLCTLAVFATGDPDVVAAPFGAGCANIVTWPLRYLAAGRPRAVLGGADPSERKFLKTDEWTFAVPWVLFEMMLAQWPASFLTTETWAGVRKKALRSRETWGE